MKAEFYKAFEDKFRGEREDIKQRLSVYLPFVLAIKDIHAGAGVVDLGCGRGEWLELLADNDIAAQGVDIDEGMLSACAGKNLNVELGDAISFLKKLPAKSQLVVSAFHLVEHIAFDDLQTLVKEALRVLYPAGLLILETPNPENIVVGASSFYLDPTHTRPIPPDLLAFLSEYYGFKRTKVLRLQESLDLAEDEQISLLNVLNGVSPDYAVVAQKTATNKLLNLTKAAFDKEYGVTLEQLTQTFSEQNEQAKGYTQWAQGEWQSAITRLEAFSSEAALIEQTVKADSLNSKTETLQLELDTQKVLLEEKRVALQGSEAILLEQTVRSGVLAAELESSKHLLAERKDALVENQSALVEQSVKAGVLRAELKSTQAQVDEQRTTLLEKESTLVQKTAEVQGLQAEIVQSKALLDINQSQLDESKVQLDENKVQLSEKQEALLGTEAKLAEQVLNTNNLQSEINKSTLAVNELSLSTQRWTQVANQTDDELKRVYASKSWRIMLSLRTLVHRVRRAPAFLKRTFFKITPFTRWFTRPIKALIRSFFGRLIKSMLSNAKLRRRSMQILNRYPSIKIRLRNIINGNGMNAVLHTPVAGQPQANDAVVTPTAAVDAVPAEQAQVMPIKKQDGINDTNKSPLEKWFY